MTKLPPQLSAASPYHSATGETREGGAGRCPANQETYRRFERAPGGVPRCGRVV